MGDSCIIRPLEAWEYTILGNIVVALLSYGLHLVNKIKSHYTSAMPRILGERERPHWLWSKSHMPCRVFYDSRPNTVLNKLLTGGQHGRCIAYDSP